MSQLRGDFVVGSKFRIPFDVDGFLTYQTGFSIFKGRSSLSNGDTVEKIPVTIFHFADPSRAIEEKNLLKSFRHPNIARHFSSEHLGTTTVMMTEEMYLTLQQYLQIPDLEILDRRLVGRSRETVAMGVGFTSFISGLADGLKAIHEAGSYHGNLLEGVRVSNAGVAKLYNFASRSVVDDLDSGIKSDILNFKHIVKMFLDTDPPGITFEAVMWFYKMCDLVPAMSGKKLRDFAYFTLTNPLLYDPRKRYHIFQKIWDWGSFNPKLFFTYMDFKRGDTSLDGWCDILCNYEESALFQTLDHKWNAETTYTSHHGILNFIKNNYGHLYQLFEGGCSLLDVEYELTTYLSHVIPVIYYKFVITFSDESLAYTDHDLVKFMKGETNSFP